MIGIMIIGVSLQAVAKQPEELQINQPNNVQYQQLALYKIRGSLDLRPRKLVRNMIRNLVGNLRTPGSVFPGILPGFVHCF
jgi:hypothetical protein